MTVIFLHDTSPALTANVGFDVSAADQIAVTLYGPTTVEGVGDVGADPVAGDVTYDWSMNDTAIPGTYRALWTVTEGGVSRSRYTGDVHIVNPALMWGSIADVEQMTGPQADSQAVLEALVGAERAVRGYVNLPVPTPTPFAVAGAVATLAARNIMGAGKQAGDVIEEEGIADYRVKYAPSARAGFAITADVRSMLSPWRRTTANVYTGPALDSAPVPLYPARTEGVRVATGVVGIGVTIEVPDAVAV